MDAAGTLLVLVRTRQARRFNLTFAGNITLTMGMAKPGPKPKRMSCDNARRIQRLVKDGKDWGVVYNSLRESLVAMTESLVIHAREGNLPPDELAASAERVSKILDALQDSGKIDAPDSRIDGFDVPGLFADCEEDATDVSRGKDAQSESGEVYPSRIDA